MFSSVHSPHSEVLSPAETASLPEDIDIRPVVTEDSALPRTRGAGKLLTRTNGIGLALLRLDHFTGAINGAARLQAEVPESPLQVQPWRPDWWPDVPVQVD
jgi:transferase CAF17, mitochondrial